MKISIQYILLTALLYNTSAFAAPRTFTTITGGTISGEILDYNVKSDVVKIKNGSGETVQTKADTFRDEDFKFVREWDAIRFFPKNTHFRMYPTEFESKNKWLKVYWRRPPGQVQPYETSRTYFNRMGNSIKFENKTGYDLEGVAIKYCIFYVQERRDWKTETKVEDIVVRPSIHSFSILPDGVQKKFELNSIVLRNSQAPLSDANQRLRYLDGDGRFLKSRMIGMILRATINTPTGQSAVREIRMPKNLSEEYVWVEPTSINTDWPDDNLDESDDLHNGNINKIIL